MEGKLSSKRQEWLSPNKLPLLVLIRHLCIPEKTEQEHVDLSECVVQLHRGLSLLLLELIQAPDLEPIVLIQRLITIDSDQQLHTQLFNRLRRLVEEGIHGLSNFFHSLDDLFVGKEPPLHKTSLFGIFTRRHILLFHKMSFSQLGHFLKLLENYVSVVVSENQESSLLFGQGSGDVDDQSFDVSMESLSGADRDKQPSQVELGRISGKTAVSSRQAEFFLARQAACIQCNESAALQPPDLQSKISTLLAVSPDIAEAHYVSHLNSLRSRELNAALESVYRYYEKQQWAGGGANAGSRAATKGEETDEEKCRRFRYAALNLATLHCQFGHKDEALAALKEAIQITQETSDHVCLEHCLGWLFRLEEDGSHHSKALLDRYVARAAELKLPYLMSLSLLTHTRYSCMAGLEPPKVFQALAQVDVINAQNSLEDLMATAHAQYSSVWQLYGKRQIAAVFSQLCPSQLQNPTGARFDVWVNKPGSAFTGELDLTRDSMHNQDGEALCLSLCELVHIHMDQGMFAEALAILYYIKSRFPRHSKLAQLGLMTESKLQYRRSMYQNNWKMAEEAVSQIRAVDKPEAEYSHLKILSFLCCRLAVLMICRGQYSQAYAVLSRLIEENRDKASLCEGRESAVEFQISLLLAMAQLLIASDNPVSSLPFLLNCLTISSSHYMDGMAAKAVLQIAYVQLLLDQPNQAQTLVKSVMVQVLAHGCLHLQCSAQFLLVKCQLAKASISAASKDKSRKSVLLSVLNSLETVLAGFRKLQAKDNITDVIYHKCMIYDELGYVLERNRCAKECSDILKKDKSRIAPTLVCLP